MLENKRDILSFIILIVYVLGGFLGIGVWMFFIPLCLFFLIKLSHCGFTESTFHDFCPMDYCVLAVCVSEILSCAFSVNIPNSIKASAPIVVVAFFWFFIRIIGISKNNLYSIITGGSYLALFFSLITVVSFIRFKSDFSAYGSSITNFKQEYTPMNMPVNDWVSFLLCLLPYPFVSACLSENKLKRFLHAGISALLTLSVVLSLSRGAYIALAVFYMVSFIYFIVFEKGRKRKCIGILAVSGFFSLLLAIPANKEVITTCTMSSTTSQRMSNDGRVQLLEESISLWKDKPMTGAGAGNFNIVYDSSVVDRKASSTRATNVYALILVEKGIVGILAYCGLAIAVLICFLVKRSASGLPFFFACFAALCVRGLFFSSMFDYKAVLMLAMLVLLIFTVDIDEVVEQ